VIQEFTHVRARRRSRQDAARYASLYADVFSPLLEVGEHDLRAGLELFAEHDPLGAFDAVLAAAAIRRGATAFVSADSAFGAVAALPYHDLARVQIDALA
jgi:predicted nucleic acid-binding protein